MDETEAEKKLRMEMEKNGYVDNEPREMNPMSPGQWVESACQSVLEMEREKQNLIEEIRAVVAMHKLPDPFPLTLVTPTSTTKMDE